MSLRKHLRALGFAAGAAALAPAYADSPPGENADLDRIPIPAPTPAAPPAGAGDAGGAMGKHRIEAAFEQGWNRNALAVAAPPPLPATWAGRVLLDTRDEWRVGDGVTLAYSGRLNARVEQHVDFPDHENLVNDLREAYVAWRAGDSDFIDAGRINVKSGVALGWNPTDFFKARSVSEALSADPTALREDRLGTVMLRGEHLWAGGSFSLTYTPALAAPLPIASDYALPSVDPMLGRTNGHDRFQVTANIDAGNGFSPEFLAYHAEHRTLLGTNLTQNLGQAVVGYVEWTGGVQEHIGDEALAFGRSTGQIPAGAPAVLAPYRTRHFLNEVAAGASYTAAQSKLTLNVEFLYNGAGFSNGDWQAWYDGGRGAAGASPPAGQLWFVRAYALDQQQPLSQRYAFVRADWVDAFVPKLALTGFAMANLGDRSQRIQLAADYLWSDQWTIGAVGLMDRGACRSEFGSLAQSGSVLFSISRYF